MEDILIIGGSYFAGRVFVEGLLTQEKYNVFVFNRGNLPLGFNDVTELVGDRNNEDLIKNEIPIKDWSVIVDFCAYEPDHVQKLINSIQGNVNHYIFISTTSVYEDTDKLPVDEDSPKLMHPQPELGEYANYGYDKWQAERMAINLCEKKGIPYTILRPAIIYGKYNYAPRETFLFELVHKDEPLVVPDPDMTLFSFVWVVDLARIVFRCMSHENVFNHSFNVSSPEQISYTDLVKILKEITGKEIQTTKIRTAEIARLGLPLPFPPDRKLVYAGSKISQLLDFQYTPFVEGMHLTYKYFKWLKQQRKE